MDNRPLVSILMPVRNEAAFIQRSVGSVLRQDYPADRMEVIVADGMSTDGTRDVVDEVASRHLNVRLIDNFARIAATGLNLALREARGEVIIRVDGHCEIASDYVSRSVSHLINDNADCVGGPLETIGETLTARSIAVAMSSRFGVGGALFRLGTDSPKYVDSVAFPAYKRETLEKVGEFDEELVRNQDDEYNYRLRKLGGRILLSPDVRARYYSRAGFRSLWRQYFQYGFWKVRVMQKHPRQMRPRQFAPAVFVSFLLVALLLALFTTWGVYLFAFSVATYGIAAMAASASAAAKRDWHVLPLLPLVFPILHVAYGAGFLVGLVRFIFSRRRSPVVREKVVPQL